MFVSSTHFSSLEVFMLAKRILLTLIALAFGILTTWGITKVIGTTPGEFGGAYFTFTSLSLAIALGIWLDKFMVTEILAK